MKVKEGQLVLCAAMEKEFLKPYIDLFDEMGISLESIDIMTNSIIKLTESIPKFNKSILCFNSNQWTRCYSLFIY